MRWIWQPRRQWGRILLAVWLIATGLLTLSGAVIAYSIQALAILAIAAGVLLLMQR